MAENPCDRCGLHPWQASLLRRVLDRRSPDDAPAAETPIRNCATCGRSEFSPLHLVDCGGPVEPSGPSGTCARCGDPITLPPGDPDNREMAVCTSCDLALLHEHVEKQAATLARVREEIDVMMRHAQADHPRNRELVQPWGFRLLIALDGHPDAEQEAPRG